MALTRDRINSGHGWASPAMQNIQVPVPLRVAIVKLPIEASDEPLHVLVQTFSTKCVSDRGI